MPLRCLESECPECKGNMMIDESDTFAACEDCNHQEAIKNKTELAFLLASVVEYGPREKRLTPTRIGKLLLRPFDGLSVYLRDTLKEAVRGQDLEDYDLEQLKQFELLEEAKDEKEE